jgi:hypothetical protein
VVGGDVSDVSPRAARCLAGGRSGSAQGTPATVRACGSTDPERDADAGTAVCALSQRRQLVSVAVARTAPTRYRRCKYDLRQGAEDRPEPSAYSDCGSSRSGSTVHTACAPWMQITWALRSDGKYPVPISSPAQRRDARLVSDHRDGLRSLLNHGGRGFNRTDRQQRRQHLDPPRQTRSARR